MRKPRARTAGLIITALAGLVLAGCTSGGTPAAPPAAAPPSSSAPTEQPAGAWTTPQYRSATTAAKAAGCEIVGSWPTSEPQGSVHCNMPEPDGGMSGEIAIAVFTTPGAEQRSADSARQLADESGDIYLVQGKGWLAECIDLGGACTSVQAKIGGELAHYTQWNN